MKFLVITDRELQRGLAVAAGKHNLLLDGKLVKYYAEQIQKLRSQHRISFIDARDSALSTQTRHSHFPALKCALGALFAERKKMIAEETATKILEENKRQFAAELRILYGEDELLSPDLLPIDPDAETCAAYT